MTPRQRPALRATFLFFPMFFALFFDIFFGGNSLTNSTTNFFPIPFGNQTWLAEKSHVSIEVSIWEMLGKSSIFCCGLDFPAGHV